MNPINRKIPIKNIISKYSFVFFFFISLFVLMLLYPAKCLVYSLNGLNLWFQKMVPSLFPFMVLSGIIIRMNLTDKFTALLKPLFYPLFKLNNSGIFAIITGFLFGFPMGARTISDLYRRKKINKAEAGYLLAFCNNIGPIYFISFVLSSLQLQSVLPYLFAMYGLPFCYGIVLRHTIYKHKLSPVSSFRLTEEKRPVGFLEALDDSITSGLQGITQLGGYMIFFNLLNILPHILLPQISHSGVINALLEITSGISVLGSSAPLAVLIILPFGGLSCIAQTYSVIKETDLSIANYVAHKLILTAITVCYYAVYLSMFSLS